MANTFTNQSKCTGTSGSHYTLKLSVTIDDGDTSTLATPITIKLTRTRENSNYINYGYSNPTKIYINGTLCGSATPKSNHDDEATQTLITKTGTIYHGSDGNIDYIQIGTYTISGIENNVFDVSASFTSSSPKLSGGSVETSVEVDALAVNPNEISNVSTFILGFTNPTITISKSNDDYKTTLYCQLSANDANSEKILIVNKISSSSYTWTLSSEVISKLKALYPNSAEGELKFYAYTYKDDTQLDGYSTYTQTFTLPSANKIKSISTFVLGDSNPVIYLTKSSSDFTTTLEYEISNGDTTLTGTIVEKTSATSYEWELSESLISAIDTMYSNAGTGTVIITATTYYGSTQVEDSVTETQKFSLQRVNVIVDVTPIILGETNPTITIQKLNDAYTTSLYDGYTYDEDYNVVFSDDFLIADKISGTSYTWELSEEYIEKLMQNSTSNGGYIHIYAVTYDGDTQIGEYVYASCEFTISDIYKPVINKVVLTELNDRVATLTDKIVRYQSKISATIFATAGKNRTLEYYSIAYGTKLGASIGSAENVLMLKNEFEGIGYEFDDEGNLIEVPVKYTDLMDYFYYLPDGVTSVTKYTAEVRDERYCYSDEYEIISEFVPYVNLTLDRYSISRLSTTSNYIRVQARGKFFDSDELGKQNELIVSYKYREKGTLEWKQGKTVVRRNNGVTYSNGEYNLNFVLTESLDYRKKWEFKIYLSDLLLDLTIDYLLEDNYEAFIESYSNRNGSGYGIIAENENGDRMVLNNSDDIAIEYLDGFYSLGATISTTKIGVRDGEKLSARSVNKRNIGIYLYIKKNVSQNRISLYKIFKAKGKVKLSYYSRYRQVAIEGYVEDITITPHQQMTQAQIIIVCPKPFLKNIEDIVIDLSKTKGNFYFPFYVTDNKKALGYNLSTTAREIQNDGDYETGMLIKLKAKSSVTNPYIFNEDNDFFQLGTLTNAFKMSAGDELIIDTETKTVTLLSNTEETNVFNYIAPNSKWLKLHVGTNTINYSNSSQVEMDVVITYNNKYEGV